jgi:sugar-specific transcriptional regulator TrmB
MIEIITGCPIIVEEMSDQTDKLETMLVKYGINPEEARIYLYLSKYADATALQISRELHLSRTKVYRILDKLSDLGLVSEEVGSRGFYFKAAEPNQLQGLISKKQSEVTELESLLPYVSEEVQKLTGENSSQSNVRCYKGKSGLEQVTWNSLRAQNHLYIYEMVSDMTQFLDKSFSEVVRQEIVKRRIHVHQITNLNHIEAYTKITEKVEKYWEPRYIDPKILNLTYEFLVYNDVVAMYNIRNNNVFCVEIYDKNLASMQSQLFNFIWGRAQKMQKIGKNGEAKLID